eukprot:5998808-Alexandrium_andersonii.AAC.1
MTRLLGQTSGTIQEQPPKLCRTWSGGTVFLTTTWPSTCGLWGKRQNLFRTPLLSCGGRPPKRCWTLSALATPRRPTELGSC